MTIRQLRLFRAHLRSVHMICASLRPSASYRPRPVGCRYVARYRTRVRAGNACRRDAVLVIDETRLLEAMARRRAGFARQYTGSAGKITELPDRRVCFLRVAPWPCLHRSWALSAKGVDGRSRPPEGGACTSRCGVCNEAPDCTPNDCALASSQRCRFAYVAADSVYGTGDIETMLRKAGKGYVLGVAADHVFRSWGKKQLIGGTAAKIAQNLPKSSWRRLSSGEGTKGPRLHEWAYLELADLDAADYNSALTGEWTRGLLIRRNIADGALAFFSTWCPRGTPREKLVSVEGHRWAIEDSFETAKNELGLDHNETRSWHGWHRHVSLVMLAFAMVAAIRHHANHVPLKKTLPRLPKRRRS